MGEVRNEADFPSKLYKKRVAYRAVRAERFLQRFTACVPRGTWQSTLEGIARGLYEVIRKHPNWAPVMAHHSGPASAGLSYIDESLGMMMKDGFGFDAAVNAYLCALSFAVGSALSEHVIMGANDGSAKFLSHLKDAPCPCAGTLWQPSFRGGKARRLSLGRCLRVRNPVAAQGHRDLYATDGEPVRGSIARALSSGTSHGRRPSVASSPRGCSDSSIKG
jgi:hypothetical protein